MQDCFRLHPEIYGSELEGDMDDDELDVPAPVSGEPLDPKVDHPIPSDATAAPVTPRTPSKPAEAPPMSITPPASTEPHPPASEDHEFAKKAKEEEKKRAKVSRKAVEQSHQPIDESEKMVPKTAHDATDL
jgi:mitochondrial intermembrane space import and assembly protein 40